MREAAGLMQVVIQTKNVNFDEKTQESIRMVEDKDIEKVAELVGKMLTQQFDLCSHNSSETFFTRARYLSGIENCCQLLSDCKEEEYADIFSKKVQDASREI